MSDQSVAAPNFQALKFQYRCSFNHEISGPKEFTMCPVWRLGEPCEGTLKRVGEGSRKSTVQEDS